MYLLPTFFLFWLFIQELQILVLDIKGKLFRAQVKYCSRTNTKSTGSLCVGLRKECRNNGKVKVYTHDEVDVLLVYAPIVDKVLWIEPSTFSNKISVTIRIDPCKNNQTKKILHVDNLNCPFIK
jgi:hypothetical protein